MNGVEQSDRLLRLVRLKWADEMQLDVGMAVFESRPLTLCFLHTILTERAMACIECKLNVLDAKRLCHRDERDGCGIAPGLASRSGNPGFNLFEPSGGCFT